MWHRKKIRKKGEKVRDRMRNMEIMAEREKVGKEGKKNVRRHRSNRKKSKREKLEERIEDFGVETNRESD